MVLRIRSHTVPKIGLPEASKKILPKASHKRSFGSCAQKLA